MKDLSTLCYMFDSFLKPYWNTQLDTHKLSHVALIDYLKGNGKCFAKKLTVVEVACTVVAFDGIHDKDVLVNQALVLALVKTSKNNIKTVGADSDHKSILSGCWINPESIAGVSCIDKIDNGIARITVALEAAGARLDTLNARDNMIAWPCMNVLKEQGLTQKLLNTHLRPPILKILKVEYPLITFSDTSEIAALFRQVIKNPREDDNPHYLYLLARHADCAALAP